MKTELYLAIVGHHTFYWELLKTKKYVWKNHFLITCARNISNICLLFDCQWLYSTDIVFLCRFSVWGVFPRRFRLVWQTVFLRFRLHRFVPFSIRKSVCVTDQSKAVTRRFLSLQKTSFTHAQILQTKTAFAETLFRQEPIRFT